MPNAISELNAALEGRYGIEHELGLGGMATVYLARDLKHGRPVALKVLSADAASHVRESAFAREIDVVAGLSHPNILPLYDSGWAGDRPFFVMPYVEGGSLRGLLSAQGALPVDQALLIVAELADALQVAHENGIVHCDLKPENVLLSRGHAMLGDFGIAAAVDRRRMGRHGRVLLGTPRYMSPEQASDDGTLDAATDLYSLGCVLFEMLTGAAPFEERSPEALIAAHLTKAPPSLAERGVNVPELQPLLDELLAKEPAARPPSATSVLRRLRGLLRESRLDTGVSGAPNVGRIVARLCDRWRQVNAFDAFLRTGWQEHPRRPHVYVVHGEEGSAHGSLVDRLAQTRIRRFADQITTGDRGRVTRVHVPWPTGFDLALLARDLPIALFREIAPSYMGDDLSAGRLLALPALSRATIVMIEHNLHATHWNRTSAELFDWYVHTFLASIAPSPDGQQVLVFAKVSYPATRATSPLAYLKAQRTRKRLHADLSRILRSDRDGSLGLVMDELTDITLEDVKDWFVKNRIYDSEAKQNLLAASVLAGARSRKLASVEAALEEIHSTFVTEHAAQRGDTS